MNGTLPAALLQQTLLMRASILANTAVNEGTQPSLSELQMLLGFGGTGRTEWCLAYTVYQNYIAYRKLA
jgi:hypothetical protein